MSAVWFVVGVLSFLGIPAFIVCRTAFKEQEELSANITENFLARWE